MRIVGLIMMILGCGLVIGYGVIGSAGPVPWDRRELDPSDAVSHVWIVQFSEAPCRFGCTNTSSAMDGDVVARRLPFSRVEDD